MKYITVDDVLKSVKTTAQTTELTEAVENFIEEEEAILDGLLAYKYKLPIPSTDATVDARRILRGVVAYKVLTRVEMFLNIQGEEGQAIVDKATYWGMYKNTINMIAKNKIKLEGVDLIDNFIASNFPKAKFNRKYDQW